MHPYVYSKERFEKFRTEWEQGGFNVAYDVRNTKYDGALTSITKKIFYTMSFEYQVMEFNE